MKQPKFVKKTIQPVFRKAKLLAGFNPKSKDHKLPVDSFSGQLPDTGLNLNIMSFNIRRGTAPDGKNHWIFRRDLVGEVLKHYRPDVLGLQEALDFQISEIRVMIPGYEMVNIISSGDSKVLHNAIFYNAERFSLSEEGTFWYSDTPDIPESKGWGNIKPRTCTWARLMEKESGQAFYFYNTHLDHLSPRSRKRSVVLLIKRISVRSYPDAFVLTGDFNSRERSKPIQYLRGKILLNLKEEGQVLNPDPLMDTFRVRYPNHRKIATFHGYRRFFFRFRLDYIFVPSTVSVHDAQIIQLRRKKCYPSDHFPLFSRINLPVSLDPSGSPTPKGGINQ
jgi:endonuclease/exonuclease/phosphatase family metal-dependent hydrolase